MTQIESSLAASGYVLGEDSGVWHHADFGSIAYNDGDDSEVRLWEILRNASDKGVFSTELAAACSDWPSRYHLSSERGNIMRPFAAHLQPGARVLEIGAGCGAVTRYLGESGANVLALEGSLRRAAIARERTSDLPNVAVLAERFQDLAIDERFDVVTLIGVLEYASLFSDAAEPAVDMLIRARKLLAPCGRLVIAIENKIGLKYLAGVPEDHLGEPMVGVENRYAAKGARTYGRVELEKLLEDAGYAHRRVHVPMPDYKMPATILSAAGCAADPAVFDVGALASQAVRRDPQLTPTTFNLQRVWKEVAANRLVADLANSFLVEACAEQQDAPEDILAWHFSTQRRALFARETVFVSGRAGIAVRSRGLGSGTSNHAHGAVAMDIEPECAYIRGELYVDKIREVLTAPGWRIGELSVAFSAYLDGLDVVLEGEGLAPLARRSTDLLPDHYLDATPSNLIRGKDGRIVFFDREWKVDAPTLGWLMTRSVLFSVSGTPVAPMHREGACTTLRELTLQLLGQLLDGYNEASFESALEKEIEFQVAATGRDPRAAMQSMAAATIPVVTENMAEPAPDELVSTMQRFDGIQHALNLSAQHQLNVFAFVEALGNKVDSLSEQLAARHSDELMSQQIELMESLNAQMQKLQEQKEANGALVRDAAVQQTAVEGSRPDPTSPVSTG